MSEVTRSFLLTRTETIVRRAGLVPDLLVAEVAGVFWEVSLIVGVRSWRFGHPSGEKFRFSEVVDGREVVFHDAPVAASDPSRTWPRAEQFLARSLHDPRFRGFDCPVI